MTPDVAGRLVAYVAQNRMRLAALHPGVPVSTEEVSAELARDAQFAEIGLCSFWRDPTVEEVRRVLLTIRDPYGVGPPVDVLAAAITLACSKRSGGARMAAIMVGIAFLGWIISRGSGGRGG